ncbi:MAG TPA: RNA polymerase sigma factor region1.1 domain-containing protein, partial [Candidatus Paceibacterota bacterium]
MKKKLKKTKPAKKPRKISKKIKPQKKKVKVTAPKARKKAKLGEKYKDHMDELVARGKLRGFVTYSEILHMMPNIEQDITVLEKLYERLSDANIELVESKELLETPLEEKTKKEEKKEVVSKVEDEIGRDAVQMYLMGIGKISLLTGDEEKELAKKILHGNEEARQ